MALIVLKLQTPKDKRDIVNGANTVEICSTAPLLYLLIVEKAIELEKVSISDMENLRTVC